MMEIPPRCASLSSDGTVYAASWDLKYPSVKTRLIKRWERKTVCLESKKSYLSTKRLRTNDIHQRFNPNFLQNRGFFAF